MRFQGNPRALIWDKWECPQSFINSCFVSSTACLSILPQYPDYYVRIKNPVDLGEIWARWRQNDYYRTKEMAKMDFVRMVSPPPSPSTLDMHVHI